MSVRDAKLRNKIWTSGTSQKNVTKLEKRLLLNYFGRVWRIGKVQRPIAIENLNVNSVAIPCQIFPYTWRKLKEALLLLLLWQVRKIWQEVNQKNPSKAESVAWRYFPCMPGQNYLPDFMEIFCKKPAIRLKWVFNRQNFRCQSMFWWHPTVKFPTKTKMPYAKAF